MRYLAYFPSNLVAYAISLAAMWRFFCVYLGMFVPGCGLMIDLDNVCLFDANDFSHLFFPYI
jgi:hypothetical protein